MQEIENKNASIYLYQFGIFPLKFEYKLPDLNISIWFII